MKISQFDPTYSMKVALGSTTLHISSGSNNALGDVSEGGDVVGEPGDYTVVGLRDQVSLSSNIGGTVIGDVLTIVSTSPRIAKFATPSNTSSIGSNALLKTTGGEGRVIEVASSGSAYTVMVGAGNTWDITLTAACTLALTGAAASGYESSILLILRQDGSGSRTVTWPGSVVWASGSPPTLSTTPDDLDFVMLETWDNGTTWYGFPPGGSTSIAELDDIPDVNAPSPSDGDVLTWDSTPGEWVAAAPASVPAALDDLTDVNAPTPADGDVLTWDSTPGEWVASAPGAGSGRWELAVIPGSPPDPLYADGDYLYIFVP